MTQSIFGRAVCAAILALSATAQIGSARADGITEIPDVGNNPEWVFAIHGGAGDTDRASLSAEKEARLRVALRRALDAGAGVLDDGGTGSDAIEAALKILEDSPDFNAGRGAALDEHGRARHDASIMRGEDHAAGAIAGSARIRNPIAAAKAVMERTDNVLLNGDGADWFANAAGLDMAEPLYFVTEERRQMLLKERASPHGTVGAVALDRNGNLAAGTSTGGRTNKRHGRIGDTPIIGAGTYASNASCAVSGTGHGEFFMRWTVARDICARVELAGETLERAAEHVVVDALLPAGGTGAVIALDTSGKIVFVATTANLKRGVVTSSKPARVAVYSDENVK